MRYTLGLDVGLFNDKTCLTIAHRERRDDAVVVVVDHQEVWRGTKDRPVDLGVVEDYRRETVRQYPGRMVFDPWQSVHLAQRLRARGISVEEFTFSSASVGRLAVTLYRLLRDGLLDLPDDGPRNCPRWCCGRTRRACTESTRRDGDTTTASSPWPWSPSTWRRRGQAHYGCSCRKADS